MTGAAVLQTGVLGVTWTNAAIMAAVVAGTFTITRELLTFALERLRKRWDRDVEQQELFGRIAQHYFQMAVGASKALVMWSSVVKDLQNLGLPGTSPPAVDFLDHYDDATLPRDTAKLAAVSPEAVSLYHHALRVRNNVAVAAKDEAESFASAPFFFSFPRTRNNLRTLLEHCLSSLHDAAQFLPKKPWYRKRPGPRENYETGATNLGPTLAAFPPIPPVDIANETFAARGRLRLPRPDVGKDS